MGLNYYKRMNKQLAIIIIAFSVLNLNAETDKVFKDIFERKVYPPMKGEGHFVEMPSRLSGVVFGVPSAVALGLGLCYITQDSDAFKAGGVGGFILGDAIGKYIIGYPLYCTKKYAWEAPLDYMFEDNDKVEDFIVEYGWEKPKYYIFNEDGIKKNIIVKYLIIEPKNILFGENNIEDGMILKYAWIKPNSYIYENKENILVKYFLYEPKLFLFGENNIKEGVIVKYLWTIPVNYIIGDKKEEINNTDYNKKSYKYIDGDVIVNEYE